MIATANSMTHLQENCFSQTPSPSLKDLIFEHSIELCVKVIFKDRKQVLQLF